MFGFLRRKPTCPIHPVPKEWIEGRLEWLFQQFDADVFLTHPVLTPTRDLLSDDSDGTDDRLRRLLDRVCEAMGVAPSAVDLEVSAPAPSLLAFVNEGGHAMPTGFGGLYVGGDREVRTVIAINRDELCDPAGLAGTIAHELAHHRLLGEGRVQHDAFDHELLTDLTALFHGFGVLLANSPRNWPGDYGTWPGTSLKNPEYLTPPMFGYTLAHAAWLRNEENPAWAAFLRYDVRAPFLQGLRYLRETEDSLLAVRQKTPPQNKAAALVHAPGNIRSTSPVR